jgi:hypothetical protein
MVTALYLLELRLVAKGLTNGKQEKDIQYSYQVAIRFQYPYERIFIMENAYDV